MQMNFFYLIFSNFVHVRLDIFSRLPQGNLLFIPEVHVELLYHNYTFE